MNCAVLFKISNQNHGFGSHKIGKRERLLGFLLEIEPEKVLRRSGRLFLKCIDSVPLLTGCCSTPTDKWVSYQGVLPSKRHRITTKGSGETNHIERFNNTLRQRVSRLVRKTLAFSKKLINHIGAILCFIDHYLATL